MTTFDQALTVLLGEEGGFTDDPRDRGNWTGGQIGSGILRGTMWGLSAPMLARYFPGRDPRGITRAEVGPVYQAEFWAPCACAALPPPIALVVFDAAVNTGPGEARHWLQAALGVRQDGDIGPVTQHAAGAADWQAVVVSMVAARIVYSAALPGWAVEGRGWAQRLAGLPFKAMELAG